MVTLKNFQNGALVVNPCHRQPLVYYCHDNMVGFDVTIHDNIMDEACDVARLHWYHVKELLPLMGHVSQLNLDIDSNILLEIAGTQALQ